MADDEVPNEDSASKAVYKVLRPDERSFIPFLHEGASSQLKGAAVATVEIQERTHDLRKTLKDAIANVVQSTRSRAILIDTLSLERRGEG